MRTLQLFFAAMLLATGCGQPAQPPAFDRLGLEEITIDELRTGYENGEFTVQEVVQAYLERIEAVDRQGPSLNSVRYVNPGAMEAAAILDRELQDGISRGPLHGIPVLLKDNIDTIDMPTTAGSRFMEESVPPEDAFIVKKLREAGAVVLGKTNLSEWANFHSSFSSSGWSGLGGQVRNPYELSRNPCGSSSGSGTAAAANLATVTLGTETNGSIVCPSHANGIVGLKPTVGLWSRSGIIPISHTLDSAGPMTRTVRDAAILLGALAGTDDRDEMTLDSDGHAYDDYTRFLTENGLEGKRIGFYTAPLGQHYRVDTLMQQEVRLIESLGAEIVEIDRIASEDIGGDAFQVLLYEFKDGLNTYLRSLGNEAPLENIQDLAGRTRADPAETVPFDRNLILTAADMGDLDNPGYTTALENMQRYSREQGIDSVMTEHNLDAIIAPTGSPAWKTDPVLGDNIGISSSSPSAWAGYPVITVPMGSIDGLPVGLSVFGRAWSEPVLLEIAYAYEQATMHRMVPDFNNCRIFNNNAHPSAFRLKDFSNLFHPGTSKKTDIILTYLSFRTETIMNHMTSISVLLAGLVLLASLPANAQKGQGDLTGVAREGELPPVETISGELLRIETGPCESTTGHAYVGTHVFLKTAGSDEPLNIHLGAAYAVSSFVKGLEAGQTLDLEVFRTERMETNHFIAKSLTANDHKFTLRDDYLRPVWAGGRGAPHWDARRMQPDDRRILRDDRTLPRGSRFHTPRRGRW